LTWKRNPNNNNGKTGREEKMKGKRKKAGPGNWREKRACPDSRKKGARSSGFHSCNAWEREIKRKKKKGALLLPKVGPRQAQKKGRGDCPWCLEVQKKKTVEKKKKREGLCK